MFLHALENQRVVDRAVASCLQSPERHLVSVWNRDPAQAESVMTFPELAGADMQVSTVFPSALPEWGVKWDSTSGRLAVRNTTGTIGARLLELRPMPDAAPVENHS